MFVYFFRENRAKCGSVCVANHTTPIDIVMLAVDNSFTLVCCVGEFLTSDVSIRSTVIYMYA